jgi:hypothetical protein
MVSDGTFKKSGVIGYIFKLLTKIVNFYAKFRGNLFRLFFFLKNQSSIKKNKSKKLVECNISIGSRTQLLVS